jgi:hypothetical protein
MSKILFSASIAVLALGMSAPTFAQDYTFMGTPVPADQVETLQARCDELFAAEPAGTEAGIGAGTEQDTKTTTETTTENADDEDVEVDFTTLDLATVTLEDCKTGGFTASTAM